MSDAGVYHAVVMDTLVSVRVVGTHDETVVERAFDWFRAIEAACSRFDPDSEVLRLTNHVGTPVYVGDVLFETLRFALALAEETNGAFDPTVGHELERRGFDREYKTGETVRTTADDGVTFRDVSLDAERRAVTLNRALVVDLGAVAKGFAVDMAVRELRDAGGIENFAIDAGGDLYLAGYNAAGEAWSAGIRHPRDEHAVIETLRVSNAAVCTSGDYQRRNERGDHHILDPRTGVSAESVASVTVIAPLAMVADGLATAAFVLGPTLGIELLERHGVEGLIVTPSLERISTRVSS